MEEIISTLEILKNFYNEKKGVHNELIQQRDTLNEKMNLFNKKKEEIELKKVIIKDASDEARNSAKAILESMSTNALQTIISPDKRVEIIIDEKAGQPVADILVFEKQEDGTEVDVNPAEEDGGGLADVVSLGSFISLLQLAGNSNIAPLVLDEPSKYVSKGFSLNVAKFLYEVSSYFNRQIFMVTHDESLANVADSSYYVRKINGCSQATKIKG